VVTVLSTGIRKVVPVLKYAPRHDDVQTSAPSALSDGNEWSVSRSDRINLHGKTHWYPLHRKVGGPQSMSRIGGLAGNRIPVFQTVQVVYVVLETSGAHSICITAETT
jgi:hypothetical protein